MPRAVPAVEDVLRRCVAIFHTQTEEQVHYDRCGSRANVTRSVLIDLITVLAMFAEHLSDISDMWVNKLRLDLPAELMQICGLAGGAPAFPGRRETISP